MGVALFHSSSLVAMAVISAVAVSNGASAAADGNDAQRTAGLGQVIVTGTRRAQRGSTFKNVVEVKHYALFLQSPCGCG